MIFWKFSDVYLKLSICITYCLSSFIKDDDLQVHKAMLHNLVQIKKKKKKKGIIT